MNVFFRHAGPEEPALACPVLDTGYLIRGHPVQPFAGLKSEPHLIAVQIRQDFCTTGLISLAFWIYMRLL